MKLPGFNKESYRQEYLTLNEADKLHNIKHELGLCIRWGGFTKQSLENLVEELDILVFSGDEDNSPGIVKRNPYAALFSSDQARINGPHKKAYLYRRYIFLLTIQKLLGSLKTLVKKEIAKIEILNDEDVKELQREEQMANENEIVALVPIPEDRNCDHNRITIKQVDKKDTKSGYEELHKFCKECRQVIDVDIIGQTTQKKNRISSKKGPKKACKHPKVLWKENFEGKVALCSVCSKEVPNPEVYRWVEAGLEPYGDDPEQDEIIILETEKLKEMQA